MIVSGPSIFRTLLIAFLAFAAVVAAAVGTAVYQRKAMVQWLVTDVLTARGLGSTRFVVEQFDLGRLVLSGVRTDVEGDLSAGRIAVRYTPLEILDHHVRHIEIEGFRFVLADHGKGDGLSANLPDSLFASSGGDGASWTVGTVDLRDTSIAVEGPWAAEAVVDGIGQHLQGDTYSGTLRLRGSVTPPRLAPTQLDGSIAFTASPQGLQELTGTFTADPLHLPEVASRTGRLEATLENGFLALRGEVLTDDGRIDLEAEGPLPDRLSPDAISGKLRITAEHPPLPGLEARNAELMVSVAGGSATLNMEIDADEGMFRLEAAGPVPERLTLDALSGNLRLTADRLRLPEIPSREGRLDAALEDGLLTLRGEMLTDNGRIDLDAEGPMPQRFSVDAISGRLRVTAERPPLPVLEAQTATLEANFADGAAILNMEVVAREGRFRVDAEGPVPSLPLPTALRGQATLDIDLVGIKLPGAPAPVSVKGRALIVSDDEAMTVRALEPLVAALLSKSRPLAARIFPHAEPFLTTGPLRRIPEQIPTSAEVRIAEARIEAAGRSFTLADADATVTIDPTRQIDLRQAWISDLGPTPSLPTLKLTGRASLDDPDLRFTGTASAAGNRLVVDFDGTHSTDTNAGGARLRLHPLDFQPGELQPQDLIIGLGDDLSAVTGGVEAGGSLRWGRRARASDFTVHLTDLSFDLKGIHVDGFAGEVVIDRPWPLRTPPDQTLVARRIDVGAPVTDAIVRFRIDEQTRLAIEEARVDLLGGRFSVGSAIFDPAADRQRARVRLTGIDMETLLAIAAIDGATATGRVSGEIPLVVSRDGFSVANAALKTSAPGVLRYAPAFPPPALQGGGEGVSLMLEALKNFHYDVVSVAVDGRSGDDWSVKLHVEGQSPDFMDAYPFVFNLNLSGKLDEIIRTGLRSYELPARLGEGLSKERPRTGK